MGTLSTNANNPLAITGTIFRVGDIFRGREEAEGEEEERGRKGRLRWGEGEERGKPRGDAQTTNVTNAVIPLALSGQGERERSVERGKEESETKH